MRKSFTRRIRMKNVEMKTENNILTIQVDLTKELAHHHRERP
jgi:hypothetical protein